MSDKSAGQTHSLRWMTQLQSLGGDPAISSEEWARLLEEYRAYLQVIAVAELPEAIRGKIAASDIVQETILKGFENHNTFQGTTREELAKWLKAILVNQLANSLKAFRAKKRQLSREVSADSSLVCKQQLTPLSSIIAAERNGTVESAVSKLSDEYRESILLRHRDNLTFAEIGKRMGKSEDAARKMWARAVKLLQKELQHDESRPQ